MKRTPPQSLAAAKWILVVGGGLLLGVIVLTSLLDKPRGQDADKTAASAVTTTSFGHSPPRSVAQIDDEVPPWQAAHQAPRGPLPEGVVPASAINPPPPDTSEPPPPQPIEPPNPATNRP